MSHKANISMNGALYAWLSAVGRRMGARSVPGTARAILQAVMRAAQSEDALNGMMWMITGIMREEEDQTDEQYISEMMRELSDTRDSGQAININKRI